MYRATGNGPVICERKGSKRRTLEKSKVSRTFMLSLINFSSFPLCDGSDGGIPDGLGVVSEWRTGGVAREEFHR